MGEGAQPALSVDGLSVSFGAVHAVKGVSLQVVRRGVVGVLGANGAGKTTLLRAIMGLGPEPKGSVTFNGRELATMSTEERVSAGITLVPEGRRIFADLTVGENLLMGSQGGRRRNPVSGVPSTVEDMYELFPILGNRRSQLGGTLSGGEQQQLAIARALMALPEVLLLDEPSLGLAPILAAELFEMLNVLSGSGLTLVLVEQNASLALSIVERAYVLAGGKVEFQGSVEQIKANSDLRRSYLGVV